MEITITSHSPEQTMALGRALGRQLAGGEVIAIVGPLGSGKTHLIKGIAEGAGAADRREVNSPTFVLVNHYAGRLDLYHIDAYRLDSISEFEMLGFDDLCYPESVVLIEWADRVEPAIAATNPTRITLAHAGPRARVIRIADLPPHVKVPE